MKEKRFVVRESYISDFRSGTIVSNTQLINLNQKLGHVIEFRNATAQILNGCAGFRVLLKAARLTRRTLI